MDKQWLFFKNVIEDVWNQEITDVQYMSKLRSLQNILISTVCPYFSEKTWIRISYFLNRFLWTIIISTEGNSWIRITSVEKNCRTKSLIIMDGQDNKIIGLAYSEFKNRKSPCPKPRKCRELILHPANENMLTPHLKTNPTYLVVKASLVEMGISSTPK